MSANNGSSLPNNNPHPQNVAKHSPAHAQPVDKATTADVFPADKVVPPPAPKPRLAPKAKTPQPHTASPVEKPSPSPEPTVQVPRRPVVMPGDIALPKNVQDQITEVVVPVTEQLVLGEPDAAKMVMGYTAALAQLLEIAVAEKALTGLAAANTDPAQIEKLLRCLDRLMRSKQRAVDSVQRMRAFEHRNRQQRAAREEGGDAGILSEKR